MENQEASNRAERRKTPAGWMAQAVRRLVVNSVNPIPDNPSEDQFFEILEPLLEIELLRRGFDEAQRSGSYQRAVQLHDELHEKQKKASIQLKSLSLEYPDLPKIF
jgi:hypothetical protein